MDAIEALRNRRSVRAYSIRPVPREVTEELIDCARMAPSGMNLKPCSFVVVTDLTIREDIADLSDYGTFIQDAPVCVAIVCREEGHYLEDASCAATCLMVAARAHGLGSCWVHVHDKPYEQELGKLIGVPDGQRVVCCIAVGYGEFPPAPPKPEMSEVLHWERFGAEG